MGVSPEQHRALKTASDHFLSEHDFSYPQIDELMISIFGSDRTPKDAQAWTEYWAASGAAEEKKEGLKYKLPKVHGHCFTSCLVLIVL